MGTLLFAGLLHYSCTFPTSAVILTDRISCCISIYHYLKVCTENMLDCQSHPGLDPRHSPAHDGAAADGPALKSAAVCQS